MATFGWNQFRRKTPAKLAKLGKALVAAGTGLAAIAVFLDHAFFAGVIGGSVFVGYLLLNFFGEDEKSHEAPKQ